jgi:hypothetical protein
MNGYNMKNNGYNMKNLSYFILLVVINQSLVFGSQQIGLKEYDKSRYVLLKDQKMVIAGLIPESSKEKKIRYLMSEYEKYASAGDIDSFSMLYNESSRKEVMLFKKDPEIYKRWVSSSQKTKSVRLLGWVENINSSIKTVFFLKNENFSDKIVRSMGIIDDGEKLWLTSSYEEPSSSEICAWWTQNSDKAPEIVTIKAEVNHTMNISWKIWLPILILLIAVSIVWIKQKKYRSEN